MRSMGAMPELGAKLARDTPPESQGCPKSWFSNDTPFQKVDQHLILRDSLDFATG
jgi:hypothetical protein